MKRYLTIMLSAVLIACGNETSPPDPEVTADLVLLNGNLLTVDESKPSAQALAVVGDRIHAVVLVRTHIARARRSS